MALSQVVLCHFSGLNLAHESVREKEQIGRTVTGPVGTVGNTTVIVMIGNGTETEIGIKIGNGTVIETETETEKKIGTRRKKE